MTSIVTDNVIDNINNHVSYEIMFGDIGCKFRILRSDFSYFASNIIISIDDTIKYSTKHSSRRSILFLKGNIDVEIFALLKSRTIDLYSELRKLRDIITLRIEHIKSTRVTKGIVCVVSVLVSIAENVSPFSMLRRVTSKNSTVDVIANMSDTSDISMRELRWILDSTNEMSVIVAKIDRCIRLIMLLISGSINDNSILILRLRSLEKMLYTTIDLCELSLSESTTSL